MIIDWIGYNEGAISADTAGLRIVQRPGGLYAVTHNNIANVHPRVTACGEGEDRIEHAAGVYPIRWTLDPMEVADLITQ